MSKIFGFRKASNRKTESYWLTIYGVMVLISYQTPVAFDDYTGRYRQGDHWGPTTRRHMSEADVAGWDVIEDQQEFARRLDLAIMKRIVRDKTFIVETVANTIAPEVEHGLG